MSSRQDEGFHGRKRGGHEVDLLFEEGDIAVVQVGEFQLRFLLRIGGEAGADGEEYWNEQGDEESYYQVEVTLDDGSHVDVNLDADFNVVKTKHEGPEDPSDDTADADD